MFPVGLWLTVPPSRDMRVVGGDSYRRCASTFTLGISARTEGDSLQCGLSHVATRSSRFLHQFDGCPT